MSDAHGEQVAIGQQGGDPTRGDRQDDISALREGGQTNYEGTYRDDAAPWDDDAKVGVESRAGYAPQPQRYPINQTLGSRLITGHWLVPFVTSNDCEVIQPLLPDPLTGYGRKSIMINNNSTVTVYIGSDPSVSIARDFPLAAGATFVISKDASCGIWMISTPSVVADVRFLIEMGYIGGLAGRVS
jgi:hypothetical protein